MVDQCVGLAHLSGGIRVVLGDHLGFASLVVGVVGVAITILWPTKRRVGYVCLAGAFLVCVCWGWSASRSKPDEGHIQRVPTSPVITQRDTDGTCSNIVAGHDVKVDCSEKDNGKPQN